LNARLIVLDNAFTAYRYLYSFQNSGMTRQLSFCQCSWGLPCLYQNNYKLQNIVRRKN